MKSNIMKRMVTICLAAVICLGMSRPVFAAEQTDGDRKPYISVGMGSPYAMFLEFGNPISETENIDMAQITSVLQENWSNVESAEYLGGWHIDIDFQNNMDEFTKMWGMYICYESYVEDDDEFYYAMFQLKEDGTWDYLGTEWNTRRINALGKYTGPAKMIGTTDTMNIWDKSLEIGSVVTNQFETMDLYIFTVTPGENIPEDGNETENPDNGIDTPDNQPSEPSVPGDKPSAPEDKPSVPGDKPSELSKPTAPPAKEEVKTTTTANGATVEQKKVTQSDLNDVQKNILGVYFTDMQNIDNDTTLTAEQKQEKKAASVQTMINNVLGLNASYKSGVYGTYELTATDLSQPLPIAVDGIKAGDKAVVAHLKADGTWENVTVTNVKDGVVYAKFDSLSPVFVAAVNGSSATSPKTADAGMTVILILVAVSAVCGAGVYAKRRMNVAR